VLEERRLAIVFQPIFGFREGAILGHEALVRGPEGSRVHTPQQLFAAAAEQDRVVELNVVCIQEILRTFARKALAGTLFLNVSPQLILQRGFSQERSAKFMRGIGLESSRVVLELTEEYPTFDFRLVRESLQLYRAMGFRVAIDDLGEGFASLRLWSELRPEFVKADKHFVTGVARDPVKVQFLRAIQQIAEHCGAQVIAEGIEGVEDFRVVKDVGIACGQGYFIGRPSANPGRELPPELVRASADPRVPVIPAARQQPRPGTLAQDFLRAVDAAGPGDSLGSLLERFAASPALPAIPVSGPTGIQGVVSRCGLQAAMLAEGAKLRQRACEGFMDPTPLRVEGELELSALVALLIESDARRLADGFVLVSRGRYLGMGRSQDVMRALHESQVLAARYTSPLTLLPGQVPINEHLERLLERQVEFTAWFVEVDSMHGLNDAVGFRQGDVLIHATARLLEAVADPDLDFVGHVAGTRFVVLAQSADWMVRAERAVADFAGLLVDVVPAVELERGYFVATSRDGRESVRPLPQLAVGILPVLPGVFETRHEVVQAAKHAAHGAMKLAGSGLYVDERHGNAYPKSVLFDEDVG
jgi:EAL domain-containing protein (putative c-di-GMP-specific phosphodiesterase class I)/GGDEF domain-containing protein